jgi:predicted nuclease of predicted toxin-antitoxin system
MKFKLDECLDVRLVVLFTNAGHDAQSVYSEDLSGERDEKIYATCIEERRILITQDMAFSNPFAYSPLATEGIIVIRNPSQLLSEAAYLVRIAIVKVGEEDPKGRLWVVDRRGIRIWPAQ